MNVGVTDNRRHGRSPTTNISKNIEKEAIVAWPRLQSHTTVDYTNVVIVRLSGREPTTGKTYKEMDGHCQR